MIKYALVAGTAAGAFFLLYLLFLSEDSIPEYFTMDDIKSRGTPPPADLTANAKELVKNINKIQYLLYQENPTYKIRLHSTYRSPAHNADIGGATRSYHMQARAVDFSVSNLDAKDLQKLLYKWMISGKIPKGGIGQGSSYAHYDNKGTMSTWQYGAGNRSFGVPLSTLA